MKQPKLGKLKRGNSIAGAKGFATQSRTKHLNVRKESSNGFLEQIDKVSIGDLTGRHAKYKHEIAGGFKEVVETMQEHEHEDHKD